MPRRPPSERQYNARPGHVSLPGRHPTGRLGRWIHLEPDPHARQSVTGHAAEDPEAATRRRGKMNYVLPALWQTLGYIGRVRGGNSRISAHVGHGILVG